jgi:hypothetical protein
VINYREEVDESAHQPSKNTRGNFAGRKITLHTSPLISEFPYPFHLRQILAVSGGSSVPTTAPTPPPPTLSIRTALESACLLRRPRDSPRRTSRASVPLLVGAPRHGPSSTRGCGRRALPWRRVRDSGRRESSWRRRQGGSAAAAT